MTEDLKNFKILPEVSTYCCFEEFRKLADQTLDCEEKMIYYFGAVENLADVFSEDYERDYYIPTRLERGIALKLIIPDSPLLEAYQVNDAEQKRETRALTREMMMDGSFMIHDDVVVYFGDGKEKYALEIKAPSLAKSLKTIFDVMWGCAK